MIRFIVPQKNGRRLLTIAITEANVQRLKDDKPVMANNADVGLDFDVAIMYGTDQEDIVRQFREAGIELPDGIDAAVEGQP